MAHSSAYKARVRSQIVARKGETYKGLCISNRFFHDYKERNFIARPALEGECPPFEGQYSDDRTLILAARIAPPGGGTIMWGDGGSHHDLPLLTHIAMRVGYDDSNELLRDHGSAGDRAMFSTLVTLLRHSDQKAVVASGILGVIDPCSLRPQFVLELE